ncbi:MAG TPA: hypothetical protein ENH59_01685 [Bacteroidetes bacterium]|nr:hypothetical protein [Bacteroidota bacterium]
MKKSIIVYLSLLLAAFTLNARDQQDLVSNCALGIGGKTSCLKDFVIKLPEASGQSDIPVYKANIYLMKKQKYLFTQCNADDSEGQLIIELYYENNLIISSVSQKSSEGYPSVEFACNKTGLYTIWYKFKDGNQGMGVGIVSLLK